MKEPLKKIAIVGCGAIGHKTALFIDKHLSAKARLSFLSDKNKKAALSLKKKLSQKVKIASITELVKEADLIIETASQAAAQSLMKKALIHKKDLLILSVGALLKEPALLKKIQKENIQLYVPSGAIAGVDGLAALSCGRLKEITITTSKPPAGLKGALYLKNKKIKLSSLKKEKTVFSGDVQEAIRYFPKNINVAATLFLASGFSKIKVLIKVNPEIKRNIHKIEVKAAEAKIKIEVENVASKSNPKTSALTILSTQQLLKKIFSSVKIGN